MERLYAWMLVLAAAFLTGPGCRHKPHYPLIGSLYVISDPPGAEILIDGDSMHRMTPYRMDGIPVGQHRLELRKANFCFSQRQIEIEPGQLCRVFLRMRSITIRLVTRLHLPLQAVDMSYDVAADRLYVTGSDRILVYSACDSSIVGPTIIETSPGIRRIAAATRWSRVFCARQVGENSEITAVDLSTGATIWSYTISPPSAVSSLRISDDQKLLLTADSIGNRLIVVDAENCAVKAVFPQAGMPTDASPAGGEGVAYLTLGDLRRFVRIDVINGTELAGMATGRGPKDIVIDNQGKFAYFCNCGDLSFTIVDLLNWTQASGNNVEHWTGCRWLNPSNDPFYLSVMMALPGGGGLHTIYLPDWTMRCWLRTVPAGVGHPDPDGDPVAITASENRRYIYVLNQLTLWAVALEL